MLILREAQFGDSASTALRSSSINSSWRRSRSGRRGCGIVLLPPHGYEGQGPSTPTPIPSVSPWLCAAQRAGLACLRRRRNTPPSCVARC
ncbi:MAG: hypothetical protein IPG96_18560, partial [Proteobacteria bacterium]|nr:hypothetical protein [Pseudomonadota bacterium]